MMDAAFEQEATLPAGLRIRLRFIRPSDTQRLSEGFARLSPESRYARFHTSFRELPNGLLHELTHVDGIDHLALVALDAGAAPGHARGLAVARCVRLASDPTSAEFAVTVADDVHGRGLAGLMLRRLAAAARERGVETFVGYILTDNAKARALMRKLDAEWLGSARGVATYRLSIARLLGERRSTAA